jgi:hypothetical protein
MSGDILKAEDSRAPGARGKGLHIRGHARLLKVYDIKIFLRSQFSDSPFQMTGIKSLQLRRLARQSVPNHAPDIRHRVSPMKACCFDPPTELPHL